MKTTRIREKVKKYLLEGPKSTIEILDMINNSSRHGTTCHQLGNVLSKDRDIVKIGHVKRGGIVSGTYNICEWALRDGSFIFDDLRIG